HSDAVLSVNFSPDGRVLASGGLDGTVRLWDMATSKEMKVLRGHTNMVADVAFRGDGRLLASAGGVWDPYTNKYKAGEVVILWEVSTGRQWVTLRGHTDSIWSLCFSPDGRTLATASLDGTVKLWEVASGKERATLQGHTDGVSAVTFLPDGKTLASGG